jgi:hypothetical protein
MEKSSSSCRVEGCPNHPRYCGFCDRHYREQKHRPYRRATKLFYLLPKVTQKKLCKKPNVCTVCRKPLRWPNIVLYKYTKKMCKKCWKLTKEAKDE